MKNGFATLLALMFMSTTASAAEVGIGFDRDDNPSDVTEEPDTMAEDLWQAMLEWFEPEEE